MVYSQWYTGEEKQILTIVDPLYASKPIPATSPIQCTLKCHRRLRASYFVKDTNQCYCVLSENDYLVSNPIDNLNGMFYEISPLQVTNFCPKSSFQPETAITLRVPGIEGPVNRQILEQNNQKLSILHPSH